MKNSFYAFAIIFIALLIVREFREWSLTKKQAGQHCPGADCNQYHVGIDNGNEVQITWRGQQVALMPTDYAHGIDSVIGKFENEKAADVE